MATTIARLEAILFARTEQFDRALTKSEARMKKAGGAANLAGLAIAGGLAYGLDKSVHAAIEAETSTARLERAFKTARLSAKAYGGQVGALEDASRKLGFTDEQTKNSLGSLLVATHDMTKASHDLSVAQNVARFRHVDLEQATKMLTMAMAGSQRATKQLGIDVPKVTTSYDALKKTVGDNISPAERLALAQAKINDKQATAAKVIDTVQQKLGGQAEAYSKTAAGSMEQFHAQLNRLEVSMGTALLPLLAQVASALARGSEFFAKHTTLTKALTVALGALSAALLAAKIHQIALNLAVLANPYVAATTAIVALTAALVILQQKYNLAGNAVKFLKDHEYALLAVPVVGELTAVIIVVDKLGDAFRKVAHWVGTAVNAVKELIGWLGKIHIPHFSLPHIGSPFGDGGGGGPFGGAGAAEGRAFNVGRQLWDEIGMGENVGLRVTSGYRPGAITKHGTRSDHGYNPSRAVDMAGPPSAMALFFQSLIGRREIRQAFYDPLGSIFNGIWNSYREGGHSDHVHVAEYDKGGWLPTGPSLAINNTGRPERVVPPGGDAAVFNIDLAGERIATVVFDLIRRKAKVYENRNGRLAFGGM